MVYQNKKSKSGYKNESLLFKPPTRKIKPQTRLLLYVSAGGRCEFHNCNCYLMKHHLTHNWGNFGEMAHIYAFSKEGPRGNKRTRPDDKYLNNVDNLILLCGTCHKEIDKNKDEHPVSILRKFKKEHQKRIFYLTGLNPENKTTVVQLKGMVRGQVVDIPVNHVIEAVYPRYPVDPKGYVIDLTNLTDDDSKSFYKEAFKKISRDIDRIYEPGMDADKTQHVSLFALAPIPLLVYLGSKMSSKIPLEVYQRHRDTEKWTWKNDGESIKYLFSQIRKGANSNKVALIVSLSGKIHVSDLPNLIKKDMYVYEITINTLEPNPDFLRSKEDINNFKKKYLYCISKIHRKHPKLLEIHLFLAVPAPIAVLCGRERLPNAHAPLVIYNYNRKRGGYIKVGRIE